MQILWINIIMDGPPAQSLGRRARGPRRHALAPRRSDEPIITNTLLVRVAGADDRHGGDAGRLLVRVRPRRAAAAPCATTRP